MPTYRCINIALQSQFGIETLPEYYPPPSSPLPSASCTDSPTVPPLVDDATSTCSVHVPVLPGSQFWIAYSVSSPVPEGYYFLFKLYIDGEKMTSWSTGKEDGWRGKTMFGLFENEGGADGRRRVEKRVLCFSAADEHGRVKEGCVEIRVHRSSARKRAEREVPAFEDTMFAKNDGGISLVNAGRAGPERPKRFYKFALIDPVDQPFATFRYYYRTWDQLGDLGLLDYDYYYAESEENNLSIIEPAEDNLDHSNKEVNTELNGVCQEAAEDNSHVDRDDVSTHDRNPEAEEKTDGASRQTYPSPTPSRTDAPSSHRSSIASGTYVPLGAPGSDLSPVSPRSLRRRGRLDTYRLSMPPSIKFDAPQSSSRPLPLLQKHEPPSLSTTYRPHPAYPVEEWTVRTPSPVRSVRESITTPPLQNHKSLGITGAGLLGVISSTWKRSVSGVRAPCKSESSQGTRSASH